MKDLARLGTEQSLDRQVQAASRVFVARLYGQKPKGDSFNTLRCTMVKSRKHHLAGKKLPSTEVSFCLHLLRASHLMTWHQAHKAIQQLPDPILYGYERDPQTQLLWPKLMTQDVSAPELLNEFLCDCVDGCRDACICSKNSQPCAPACECSADTIGPEDEALSCKNPHMHSIVEYDADDND